MKKIVLVIVLVTSSLLVSAQEGLKIGVGFGPAISFSRVEDGGVLASEDNGIGSRLSLTGRYSFTDNYGLQTGIALTTKAYGDKDNASGKTSISTIELPFGIALRTNELSSGGLYVSGFFGPTIDLNVSSRLRQNGEEKNNNDNIKSIGSTVKFGLGVEKEFDFGTFLLGVSYGRGISNIATDTQPNVVTKVHYISTELSYFF